MVAPAFVLRLVGGEQTPEASHLFAIVGMFMTLFGLLLCNGVLLCRVPPIVFWSGIQKLGASCTVTIGIFRGIFTTPLAVLVAVNDCFAGVVILLYLNKEVQ